MLTIANTVGPEGISFFAAFFFLSFLSVRVSHMHRVWVGKKCKVEGSQKIESIVNGRKKWDRQDQGGKEFQFHVVVNVSILPPPVLSMIYRISVCQTLRKTESISISGEFGPLHSTGRGLVVRLQVTPWGGGS